MKRMIMIVMALLLCGCATKYKVICDEIMFHGLKNGYKAGEKVEVSFDALATDSITEFWLDDEQIYCTYDEARGCIISFTMPDHDVTLDYTIRNTMTSIEVDEENIRYCSQCHTPYDISKDLPEECEECGNSLELVE